MNGLGTVNTDVTSTVSKFWFCFYSTLFPSEKYEATETKWFRKLQKEKTKATAGFQVFVAAFFGRE
jgi:hypothetical protein